MKTDITILFAIVFFSTNVLSQSTIFDYGQNGNIISKSIGTDSIKFVDKNNINQQLGTSWQSAYLTLQAPLEYAETCLLIKEIWVADGIYSTGDDNDLYNTLKIRNNLRVYGGFQGNEDFKWERNSSLYESILSGDLGNGDSVYHVVTFENVDSTTLLDGFIIEGGRATGINNESYGGGIIIDGSIGNTSNPVLRNNTIRNNRSTAGGAGIYVNGNLAGNANPRIDSCTFKNNVTDGIGGAILNNGFQGNASPNILASYFILNKASQGAGIYNNGFSGVSNPILINNCFHYNQATTNGGSIFNNGRNGGESSPEIIGNQFAFGKASNGNAIFNDGISGSSIAKLYHNTFYNDSNTSNTSMIFNQSASPIITNSILWGTNNPLDDDPNSSSNVSYSTVQGGFSGTSIYDQDPLFVSTMAPIYIGILNEESPTFDRPVGDQSSCFISGVGTDVPYAIHTFELDMSDTVTSTVVSFSALSEDSYLALYENNFDPLNPCDNIITSNDDGGIDFLSEIEVLLQSGIEYFLVVSTYNNNGDDFGEYQVEMTTNANIVGAFDLRLSPCSYAINAGLELNLDIDSLDFYGTERPFENSLPDIGAYEFPGDDPFGPNNSIAFVSKGGKGFEDGSSWNNAISEVYLINDFENPCGGEIDTFWVAEGVYLPNDSLGRSSSFSFRDSIYVFGGFKGDETELSQRDIENFHTRLSGNIGDSQDSLDNVYQVIVITDKSNVNIDGFLVSDGHNDNVNSMDKIGAAIFIENSSVSLKNVTLTHNYGEDVGGIIALQGNNGQLYINSLKVVDNYGNPVKMIISNNAQLNVQGENEIHK